MRLVDAFGMNQIAGLQAGEFAQFALGDNKDTTGIRLAEAYQKAIKELEALEKNAKDTTTVQRARIHIVKLRDENISPAVLKGLEVLRLQKRLQKEWLLESQRALISQQIVTIFEWATSYEEMLELRETIDSAQMGASPLHTLVYHDLDTESCHAVLRLINKNVPDKASYRYRVYSDIDDTIKGSLNDKNCKIAGFYPASLEFYKQLGGELTFLSARPHALEKVWNSDLKEKLPQGTTFFALYGGVSAIMLGAFYYTIVKWLLSIADILPEGALKQHIREYCAREESKTFISFAIEKRCNIDRDLLLRPETRAIFVGDCGEGDLIFLLSKNMGVPLPFEDPKIPTEFRGDKNWEGSLDTPCNPTNKPLYLGFAHALSSVSHYPSRPDPKFRKEFEEELHAHVFDNYVENALYCLEKKILSQESCDKIVDAARSWLSLQKIRQDTSDIEALSPDKKYRLKLQRSIRAYEQKSSSETSKT